MNHTEILIRFPSFALDTNDNNLVNSSYILRIISPRSNHPGPEMFVPEPILLRASTDGELRFKLAPSDSYFPLGRYQVEYYKSGNSEPLHKESWLVPTRKGTKIFHWQVSGINDPVPMPDDYFDSAEVDWNASFEISMNQLTWLTNNPPVGTDLSVSYTAAATLDDLIELPNRNSGLSQFKYV